MKWRSYVLPGSILALLGLFVLYPTVSVLLRSLSSSGQVSLDNYVALFTRPYLVRTISNSLLIAGGTSLLSTLLGLILALVVFKTRLPLRRFFALAAVLPMIIPGFVKTVAYIFLFGRNGLLTYQLFGLS
jgi:iron(III) transport system permease protein